tara:strand:- start:13 stop:174 length:162 start_codon:yes stop_codon:yes gene_type:complete
MVLNELSEIRSMEKINNRAKSENIKRILVIINFTKIKISSVVFLSNLEEFNEE